MATDKHDVIRKDSNLVGGRVALYVHKPADFEWCDDFIKSDIQAISTKIKIDIYKPF